MTDSMRTAIARVLNDYLAGLYSLDDAADVVLAVLADPPEDMIERATEALRQDSYAVACPPWDSLTEEQKAGWLARGRLMLRAAFGGEQE